MTRNEIIEKLREILLVSESGDEEKVNNATEETLLQTELGLNSIGMLYIVIAIEQTFDIRFENVGSSDFQKLGDVVDYIEARIK